VRTRNERNANASARSVYRHTWSCADAGTICRDRRPGSSAIRGRNRVRNRSLRCARDHQRRSLKTKPTSLHQTQAIQSLPQSRPKTASTAATATTSVRAANPNPTTSVSPDSDVSPRSFRRSGRRSVPSMSSPHLHSTREARHPAAALLPDFEWGPPGRTSVTKSSWWSCHNGLASGAGGATPKGGG
jgi:hypothetical protein